MYSSRCQQNYTAINEKRFQEQKSREDIKCKTHKNMKQNKEKYNGIKLNKGYKRMKLQNELQNDLVNLFPFGRSTDVNRQINVSYV